MRKPLYLTDKPGAGGQKPLLPPKTASENRSISLLSLSLPGALSSAVGGKRKRKGSAQTQTRPHGNAEKMPKRGERRVRYLKETLGRSATQQAPEDRATVASVRISTPNRTATRSGAWVPSEWSLSTLASKTRVRTDALSILPSNTPVSVANRTPRGAPHARPLPPVNCPSHPGLQPDPLY